ncbi:MULTISPECIES: DUF4357 domain-containing protein [Cyanophyceae]|uniref:DUF4357 domain-containing protein n=1 Tax=Cyanophyceae TaxID=3028117 RepID=UPI0016886F2E|nr:DUF4357 domain-containing protein [Trichocoleus sp. FACHB-69]MBD1930507.1 DUF4357 domain-containing protein [Trichocoleus sp. FACHB-69]
MPQKYIFETNEIRATGYYENGRNGEFIVEKGSTAVGDMRLGNSFIERPENEGRRYLRQKLIQEGKLRSNGDFLIFTEDVPFNSPSQAATIIAGSNQNGLKVFGIT